eukprot:7489562-Ditylum_brightwellii.AAC.1
MGSQLSTTETINLQIDGIPDKAKIGYRLPQVVNNLVAVSELSGARCTITLNYKDIQVHNEGKEVLRGWRDKSNQLWRIPLTTKDTTKEEAIAVNDTEDVEYNLANSIHECNTQKQLIQYYHVTFFSPVKSTMMKA